MLLEEVQDKKKQSAVSYGLFDAAQAISETYKKIIENDVEQILRKNLSLL